MKIQCDVCNKEEAFVFCSADEAALCKGCDHRVHHANKLASKHHRFPLLSQANADAPICDICKERRAFLFCREDRAILCRECDIPIHAANEHTKKHNRYLLTGVKIGVSSNSCDDSCASQPLIKKKAMSIAVPTPEPSVETNTSNPSSGGGSTSSIAEYLIETLPGWHVEDFMDTTLIGFSKSDNFMPSVESFTSDDIWVPNIPPYQLNQFNEHHNEALEQMNKSNSTPTTMNKRRSDYGFAVPQISPQPNKRNKSIW